MITRREMLQASLSAAAGGVLLGTVARVADASETHEPESPVIPTDGDSATDRGYRPVVVPNGTRLPWKIVDGVKVGHLVATPVRHEIAPGLVIDA